MVATTATLAMMVGQAALAVKVALAVWGPMEEALVALGAMLAPEVTVETLAMAATVVISPSRSMLS